jgi:hypothetical protein
LGWAEVERFEIEGGDGREKLHSPEEGGGVRGSRGGGGDLLPGGVFDFDPFLRPKDPSPISPSLGKGDLHLFDGVLKVVPAEETRNPYDGDLEAESDPLGNGDSVLKTGHRPGTDANRQPVIVIPEGGLLLEFGEHGEDHNSSGILGMRREGENAIVFRCPPEGKGGRGEGSAQE